MPVLSHANVSMPLHAAGTRRFGRQGPDMDMEVAGPPARVKPGMQSPARLLRRHEMQSCSSCWTVLPVPLAPSWAPLSWNSRSSSLILAPAAQALPEVRAFGKLFGSHSCLKAANELAEINVATLHSAIRCLSNLQCVWQINPAEAPTLARMHARHLCATSQHCHAMDLPPPQFTTVLSC